MAARSSTQVDFTEHDSDFGPSMSERVAKRVRAVLDAPDLSDWEDWLYIVATIFVDEGQISDRVFRIISMGRLGLLGVDREGSFVRAVPLPPVENPGPGPFSVLDLGDPPAAAPGLVDYLTMETFRQLRERIKQERDPLTKMGLSLILAPSESLSFGILDEGVLLQNLNPGQTMIITGASGSGKTTAAVHLVIQPALKRGWRVVSNIYVEDAPKEYTYVTSLSEYLTAICKNAIDGYRTLAVRDEGALGRMKQSAMSERNRELKMLTMILRKLNAIEVTIYQYDGDVPSELRGFCTHYLRKVSREKMFVRTTGAGRIRGLERKLISEIPGDKELREMGRSPLAWRTEDIAALVHDIRVEHLLSVLRKFARNAAKAKVDPKAQFRDMMQWIERATGLKELQFTEDDVLNMIQEIHWNKPEWGWQTVERVIARAVEALGRGRFWVHTSRQALGIRDHKLTRLGVESCDYCTRHRDPDML